MALVVINQYLCSDAMYICLVLDVILMPTVYGSHSNECSNAITVVHNRK